MHDAEFKGASNEFLSARRHLRRDDFGDAITDANNAVACTPTTTCRARSISTTVGEKFERLVDTVMMTLRRPDMQTSCGGLQFATEGPPNLRNTTAGAAHGQGETLQDLVWHAAASALHLAAANMAFAVEACQDLERRERRFEAGEHSDRGVSSPRQCRRRLRTRHRLAADFTA